jgi:ribulose-5-phosphate 4-epimerase/fuculose-1-phosphate aldolase
MTHTKTLIVVTIDWPRIHTAISALDIARQPLGLGHQRCIDALGGTYSPERYESRGLAGLAELNAAVNVIAEHVWDYLHESQRRLDAELARFEPRRGDWWCVGNGSACESVSHRGAAIMAGRTPYAWVAHGAVLRAEMRDKHVRLAETALEVAACLRRAKQELAATGIRRDPHGEICYGDGDDDYGISGIDWVESEHG